MVKKLIVLFCTLFAIVAIAGCGGQTDSGEKAVSSDGVSAQGKVYVVVSFNAMKEFAEAVGGDKVEVHTIIPDGTEPHDFEPKAQDLQQLEKAQVFVYNGNGMESWAEKAASSVKNDKLITVEAAKGVEPLKNEDPAEAAEHSQYDPHVWLSLKGAEVEVKNIKDALVKADPANKDYYEKNCDAYVKQLDDLFNEYNKKFQSVQRKDIVTGHAAFGYFCRDFGLTQNSVEDTFAEGEPTAQQMAELVEYCKEHNVKTIFAEEMVSPEISQALANEVGAKVETIYTIEGAEDNMSYLDRMKSNLDKIYASLQ